MKICTKCDRTLPLSSFGPHSRMKLGRQSACRECSRDWHRANPDYVRRKNQQHRQNNPDYYLNWARRKKYGLTPQDISDMRESQRGLCSGCVRPLKEFKECVDHCHLTGKVRGLLCSDCNVSIGRLRDDPLTLRRLAEYLERHARQEAEDY